MYYVWRLTAAALNTYCTCWHLRQTGTLATCKLTCIGTISIRLYAQHHKYVCYSFYMWHRCKGLSI